MGVRGRGFSVVIGKGFSVVGCMLYLEILIIKIFFCYVCYESI